MSDNLQPLAPEEGVERFLDHREMRRSQSTVYNDRTRLKHFLEWCREYGVDDLNDLTGRDLAAFVAWRRSDVKAITVQKQLGSIRQALRWWADIEAVEEGLAEKVHAPEIPDGSEAKDVHLKAGRAQDILDTLNRHYYANEHHALLALLWRSGMRRSAAHSIDVGDLQPDDHAVELRHRPDEGTQLKNDEDGERWVYLGPLWFQILDDHLDHPDRRDVTDDYGREPLFTTRYGRTSPGTLSDWVNRATHPCEYGPCPHDRDPDGCPARGKEAITSQCPSARSPHAVRRGSITHHLNSKTPPPTVSERMDVSLEVLYKHYDARNHREKMNVRKDQLP